MITSKYFKESEFKRCTPSCSLQDMDQEFMNKLDAVREDAGIPLVLTSAFRAKAWELKKGRTGSGDHPQGKGADIRCYSSQNRLKIIKSALKVGFDRVGISSSFVHLGDGDNLPENVIWLY